MKIVLTAVNSKYVHTNLAIRYIKAFCNDSDIKLKEYTINDSLYNVIDDIYIEKPEVVGFSCYIWNIDMILKLCSSLKKLLPTVTIVLGGPEVSFDSIDLMERHPSIDFIIKGEGETSSKKLFNYLDGKLCDISNIDSLVYRNNNCILENTEVSQIKNLDSLPFPYGNELSGLENKILYYESSRGCPYNCSYCLSSTIEGVRFFSLDRVKQDLKWFIDNNIPLIKFVDRTFNCGKFYFLIFKFLVENRRNTKFHFEISAEILEDSVIRYLNTIPEGLFQFEIGVQTTNENTLELIDRKANFQKLSDIVNKLRSKGNIHLHLDLIAGLPGEDFNSFSKSFNDVFMLKPHMLQLGFLKLLKGSKLRNTALKYGINYTDYPTYEVLNTMELTFSEISALKKVEALVDRYYNSGRFSTILSFLIGIFEGPFQFFSDVSAFENSKKLQNVNLGNVEQYKFLYDFCSISVSKHMAIIKEFLAFDYLVQGRNSVVPEFLAPDTNIERQIIWDFFSQENNVRIYLPHYLDKDIKYIIKNIYFRRFTYDLDNYNNDNLINKTNRIMVFDYGNKTIYGKVNYFSINSL